MQIATPIPTLTDNDTVYGLRTYSELMRERLEGQWVSVSHFAGWASVPGYPLQIRKAGYVVSIRGMAKFNSGQYTDAICDRVPMMFRPDNSTWLQATIARGSQAVVQPLMLKDGYVQIPAGYTSKSMAGGDTVALNGTWITSNQ